MVRQRTKLLEVRPTRMSRVLVLVVLVVPVAAAPPPVPLAVLVLRLRAVGKRQVQRGEGPLGHP